MERTSTTGDRQELERIGSEISGISMVDSGSEHDSGNCETEYERLDSESDGSAEQLSHMGRNRNREEFVHLLTLPRLLQEAERLSILGCIRYFEPESRCRVDRRVFERNLKNYRREARRRVRVLKRIGRSLSRYRRRKVHERLQNTSEINHHHHERASGEFITEESSGSEQSSSLSQVQDYAYL